MSRRGWPSRYRWPAFRRIRSGRGPRLYGRLCLGDLVPGFFELVAEGWVGFQEGDAFGVHDVISARTMPCSIKSLHLPRKDRYQPSATVSRTMCYMSLNPIVAY